MNQPTPLKSKTARKLRINEAKKGWGWLSGDNAAKGWLILSMWETMTPEAIAPPPKPIPIIWIVVSKCDRVLLVLHRALLVLFPQYRELCLWLYLTILSRDENNPSRH